jgi:5-methylcytosine-specific restriction endonuclease McrA
MPRRCANTFGANTGKGKFPMPQKRIIPRTCEQCGQNFLAPKQDVKRGRGRFCCHACYFRSLEGKPSPKDARVPCVCDHCGKTFLRKRGLVAGANLHYCSAACYHAAHPREETRACPNCGKTFTAMPSRIKKSGTIYCSSACHGEAMTSENSPAWKGKNTKQRHQNREEARAYQHWRRAVRDRDNHTCQYCGTTEGTMHAHHINPWKHFPELRFDVSNGVLLCYQCHRRVHTKR